MWKPETVNRTLSFAVAGLCLALLSNAYPVLTFNFKGNSASNFLTTGPLQLMNGIYWPLALIILWTSLFAPAFKMIGLTYVLIPVKFGWRFPGVTRVFKYTLTSGKWCLIEVYAAGILVAITKLDEMGSTEMDMGAYILFGLFLCSILATKCLDREFIWEKLVKLQKAKP
ncbi:MAG: paraquat-inducible protein A [Verrucomicrobiota bacterium]|nr:paraquat-inducible protein A [Verrucomicrobiota bacterium]